MKLFHLLTSTHAPSGAIFIRLSVGLFYGSHLDWLILVH
jgi:hypothetical protein